jgi:hypothetical protein
LPVGNDDNKFGEESSIMEMSEDELFGIQFSSADEATPQNTSENGKQVKETFPS